ncbi:MAG: hypothetical protein ACFC1C_02985 [Candidatus Malihini olakiniferum]
MLKTSRLGMFHYAKLKVNEQAPVRIRPDDITGVICVLSGSLQQKKR